MFQECSYSLQMSRKITFYSSLTCPLGNYVVKQDIFLSVFKKFLKSVFLIKLNIKNNILKHYYFQLKSEHFFEKSEQCWNVNTNILLNSKLQCKIQKISRFF